MKLSIYIAVAAVVSVFSAAAAEHQAEVVVYGGTSGGVIAAVAAASQAKSVILIEPGNHLGGMTSGGLGQVDAGREETIGGLTRQYFERVAASYQPKGSLFRVTPKAAEEMFDRMAAEAKVKVLKNTRLRETDAVAQNGLRIEKLTLENGDTVKGRVFIDSSYEGDLMARSGVSYTVGRESRATYGESGAGVRQFRTLRTAFDDQGKLLPELIRADPGKPGEGDRKVQAYNFRLCVTANPANRAPFPKPDNYNPDYYRNLLDSLTNSTKSNWKMSDFVSLGDLPQDKYDLNNKGWYSTDFVNASWSYPDGSYAERAKLHQAHVDYVKGLLYFLGNDPRLPESLRADTARWGLAKDEFTDNANFPAQLYIREGRRMLGEYVMIQMDAYANATKPDTVGMGSYMLDTHWCQKVLAPDGKVYLEGLMGHLPVRPYEISYRSMVPRRNECDNLLVSTAFSASHVIYSSLRMEPVYMILGESAGIAAALAVAGDLPVAGVKVPELQAKLRERGQILKYPGGNIFPLLSEVPGLVKDNDTAEFKGRWSHSSSTGPYVGGAYCYTPAAPEETASALYRFEIPAAGEYEVNICFSPMSNRAKAAPVTLTVNGQTVKEFKVNMRERYNGVFLTLDKLSLAKGDKVEVSFSNRDADGLVVADAVQLLDPKASAAPVPPPPPPEPITLVPLPTAAILADDALSGPAVAHDADRQAVAAMADAIMARVLPDGAINNVADADKVLIIPYFSNFCAIALIQAWKVTGVEKYRAAAVNWLRWYAARVQSDGTVHDYKGGKYPDYIDSGDYDSADSYSTTFAYALWYYGMQTGDLALARELYPKLQQAMGAALEVRQDDFLTWAKRSYRIKYLMDNLEVWYGVIACAKLERQLGTDKFAHYAEWAEKVQTALGTYWKSEANFFVFAPGHLDTKRLYPGALANAFAILFYAPSQPGAGALFRRIDELILAKDDKVLTSTFPTRCWLLLAAQKAGNKEWESKLFDSIDGKIRMDKERTHAFALMILYYCGGFNGKYGVF